MKLKQIISQLYREHAQFYDYASEHNIEDFVSVHHDSKPQLLVRETSGELELRIEFPQKIAEELEKNDPLTELHSRNLNSFWIVTEEMSHFATIVECAKKSRSISRYELERQAEIDKILFAAIRLSEQHSDPHYHHLTRLLFDHSRFRTNDVHYRDAHNFAARFWQDLLASSKSIHYPLHSQTLKSILQELFNENTKAFKKSA
jgi:hypothetical protein